MTTLVKPGVGPGVLSAIDGGGGDLPPPMGPVTSVGVSVGGGFTANPGDYPATQVSTTGIGSGATFTVTLAGSSIKAVTAAVVTASGNDYIVGEVITINITGGPGELVPAELVVLTLL